MRSFEQAHTHGIVSNGLQMIDIKCLLNETSKEIIQ